MALVALVCVSALFAGATVGRGAATMAPALTGWLFGLGYFAVSLNWITEPFMVDAARDGWMAPFALVGLAGGLALLWALAFWIAGRLGGLSALVVFWTLAELARAYVLTGFPWGLVGYLWASTPVAQWHAVIGPHGLSFLTLATAALASRVLLSLLRPADRSRRAGLGYGAAALVAAAALWFGGLALRPAPADDLAGRPVVRLIQPNAPQHLKWNPAHIPTFFNRQVDLTARAPRPDLIVWPETAIPMLLHQSHEARGIIAAAAGGVPVVLGAQRAQSGAFYNSLAVLDARGEIAATYDKHHLVPFGEYMPAAGFFARFDVAGLAVRAQNGYAAGAGPYVIDLGPLGRALPLICYEAVFPQDARAIGSRPEFLLQITNDAWFGTRSGPYQHLMQARLRAIEQGLPLIRAANTGVSAVIDGAGRVLASLPLGQAGAVDHALPPPLPPTLYSRSGDGPVLAFLALLAALLTLRLRINKD